MNNDQNNIQPVTENQGQKDDVKLNTSGQAQQEHSLAQGMSMLSEGKLFDLEAVKAVLAEKKLEANEESMRAVEKMPPIPVFSVEEPDGVPYKDAVQTQQKAENDEKTSFFPAVNLYEEGASAAEPDWEELRRRRKEAERYNDSELAEYERAKKKRRREEAQKKQQDQQRAKRPPVGGTQEIPKQKKAERREADAERVRTAPPRKKTDEKRPVRRRDDGIIRADDLKTNKPKRNFFLRFLLSTLKWIIYFALIISISVYGGKLAVRWANDAFAFVKESKEVKVVIPESATTQEVALILAESGVISEPDLFRIFTMLKKNDGLYLAGEYTLDTSMDYSTIMSKLKYTYKPARETMRFTIPEGYTLEQIVALLVRNGLGTEEEFWQALQYGKFNYEFLADVPETKTRLEGFIFPDTYEVYKDEGAESIIKRLLSNFNKKFKDEYYTRAQELGLSVLEVVTLASIIEKEAVNVAEFSLVSSVFHNRLNAPDKYPYLQSCATIQYVLPERKQVLSIEDTKIDSPYNTYTNEGLPPGPIANPGEAAIYAALYPDTTNYYFFVASGNNHVFSTSYDAHLTAIRNVGSQAQGTGTIVN